MTGKKKKPASPASNADLENSNHVSPDSSATGNEREARSGPDADLNWLHKMPTLAAYVERVGAVPKNFRRYAVRAKADDADDDGYKSTREVVGFTLTKEGAITPWGEIDPPSDDELKKISDEVRAAKWPQVMPLAALRGLPPPLANADKKDLFVFKGLDDRILMIQQRVEKEDGGKYYVPYTYWDDDKWRKMEPDGKLPLWGLEQLKDAATVFVHEGAKAARAVRELVGDTSFGKQKLKAHPWGEQLSNAAHIGWIGGAPNPDRTDWGPLKGLPPDVRIIFVADNDDIGVNAIPKISKLLKRPMSMIRFDKAFPPGFDLADPWPEAFWKNKLYTGPAMADHTFPATWATDQPLPPKGHKGRPANVLRSQFAAEWVCVGKPPAFIHRRRPDRILNSEEFAFQVSSFSDTRNVARLLERIESSKVSGLCYRPYHSGTRQDPRTQIEGDLTFNVFKPSNIRPVKGDQTWFLNFMAHLIPEEVYRLGATRWIATLIARPEVRMRYSMLLISEQQGGGKNDTW